MDLQDVFISNLKRFRKEQHITQEKLAELCDTETSYIGQIETKKRFPSLTFIEKIASAINIQPYLLFKPIDNFEINKNKNHKNNKKQSYEEIFIGAGLVAAYRARQLCAEKVLCLRRSVLQPGEPV